MNAPGVWAGLADSVFLAGVGARERDPARLAASLVGGAAVGLVAAICAILLLFVSYAILNGEGARGLEGLTDVAQSLAAAAPPSPSLAVLKLAVQMVDGIFLVAFVAFAALIAGQPLIVYVTAAVRVRWRLLAMATALSVAVMAPLVVAERLLSGDGSAPPFLAVSPLIGDRLAFAVAALVMVSVTAAAEEVVFRGWLLRQTGVLLRRPLMLVGVTALTFSTLHFDFTPDAFLTRTLMGAGFAYMTLRLGGIEFAIGAHAVNNVMIVLFLQPLSPDQAVGADPSAFPLIEHLALAGGYVLMTELVARSAALRRLAGVRAEEVSPSRDVSARFG